MADIPAIGIDLGTTFSCASVYRNGRPEIIPDKDGDRIIPSVVYFDPKTGEVSVGNIADELLPMCPSNGLLDVKRFIGRKFEDEFVTKYIKSNKVHFSIVQGEDNQAAFKIELLGQEVFKSPEEVSAELLKYLKDSASEYLGGTVTEAVISVPAYFSNAQRKATKRAAELAGLKVLKLITEPTAAAIHYVSDKGKNNSKVLVFDFGGGTLDVSFIIISNNIFEVKAVYGDTLLGGRNIDEALYDHFQAEFLEKHDKKPVNKKFVRRLSNMCTNLKKILSTKEEFTLDLDRYDGGTSDYSLSMTRAKFEKINQHIFDRALNIMKLCLDDINLSKSDIDEIVLVGGSTRIPKIRQMLSSYFDNKRLKTDLNPDEAVAAGACIHAAFLKEKSHDLEKYKVTEVTPMSLGIIEKGDLMDVFIPKNSPLPFTISKNHETIHNNQKSARFRIYEGERKNVAYNNELGEFVITDLPLKRAGDVKFNVTFHLDEDGILDITASEKTTGKSNKLVVTMGHFRLSERKIKLTLEDARKYKLEDGAFQKFVILRNKLEKKCRHIMYDVQRIYPEEDRTFVQDSCNDFLKKSASSNFTEIEQLDAQFAVFYDSISEILKENSLLPLE